MASKDYEDLLESFMNNSQKVYNDDKDNLKKNGGKLPSSYNVTSTSNSNGSKPVRSRSARNVNNTSSNKSTNNSNNGGGSAKAVFSNIGKFLLAIIMIVGVVGIVCLSVITVYGYSVVYGDPVFDLNEEKYSQNQTSFIYGYDDKDKLVEISRLHGEENRIWVNSTDMSDYLDEAFIAVEDERFESHKGVDWKRTFAVTFYNLIGKNEQGGSTITQQLIKNLTDENDVTFVRKFNEILSALNLEKNYSKDEIIEAYLNTVYLSHGCYGVKTAAETYFGKEVDDLNIAECASLAAITKSPTKFDPLINPENNRERQLSILNKMKEQGLISNEQYNEAVEYEMIFTNSKNYKGSKVKKTKSDKTENETYSYYTDYVYFDVLDDLQKMGYSEKKAKSLINGGGLKIYCAVDFEIQDIIEDVYENYRRMPDETVQGACVVMDYKGRVLGVVGGTGKKKGKLTLNRATMSKRQPGSTIKPLSVYAPALQKSLDDDNVNIYWSTPTKDTPLTKIDGKPFPTNEGGWYSGNTVSVQYGLSRSLNTISAQTLDKIGIDYSFDFISNRFHISTLDNVSDCNLAPMATGSLTNGATVLEMTSAYASFGNGGYYYEPYSYYKIEDSQGNVLIEKDPDGTRESALSENTAWVMNKMLQTVMTQGTGTTYKISNVECFGKTGTTSDDKDRWFVGGTPEYVCGVWYGYDKQKEIHYYLSSNPSGTLWNLVMRNIYSEKGVKERKFDVSDGIKYREYCGGCGKLRTGTRNWGWFDEDNMPGYCGGGHSGSAGSTYKKDDYDDKKKDKTTTTKKNNSAENKNNSQNTTSQSTTKATTAATTEATTESKSTTAADE